MAQSGKPVATQCAVNARIGACQCPELDGSQKVERVGTLVDAEVDRLVVAQSRRRRICRRERLGERAVQIGRPVGKKLQLGKLGHAAGLRRPGDRTGEPHDAARVRHRRIAAEGERQPLQLAAKGVDIGFRFVVPPPQLRAVVRRRAGPNDGIRRRQSSAGCGGVGLRRVLGRLCLRLWPGDLLRRRRIVALAVAIEEGAGLD